MDRWFTGGLIHPNFAIFVLQILFFMKSEPYYVVRNSRIHGKGVFAKRPIRKGTQIVEYTGKIVSREEADEIGSTTVNGHTHTMLFTIDEDRVIDGNVGGDAKYINHSCDPNCEAVQYDDDTIFIEALKSIPKGQEITYDYHLEVPGKITDKVKKEYECFCGSANCRGTQIAASILEKQKKKEEKKKAKQEKKDLKKAEKTKTKEEKKRKKTVAAHTESGLMVKPSKKKKDSNKKDKKKLKKKKKS